MEGEQGVKDSSGTSNINFQDLHGNMNFENNNKELPLEAGEGKEFKKPEVEVIENQEEEEEGEDDSQLQEIAKGIIDKAVTDARDQVKEECTNLDPEKAEIIQEQETTAEEEWLDILGNGLLMKKVIIPGEGVESRPKREQEVTVNYVAKLQDETIVESKENLVFVVSDQDVVDALDLSICLMEKGEKAIVKSDAKYAYGADGKSPKIPPSSDLIYEIELKDVKDGPYSKTMEIEKRLEWADAKRQKGNEYYSKKDYPNAAQTYTKCLKVLETAWFQEHSDDVKKMINGLRLKCYNNLAASEMKLEKWKEALRACTAAERLESSNVKALFRKGKIQVMMGELDRGTATLVKANKLEPDNKVIAAELMKQRRRLEQQKEAQKKMYRRMLGNKDSEKKTEKKSSWFPSIGKVVAGSVALGAILVGIYVAQRG